MGVRDVGNLSACRSADLSLSLSLCLVTAMLSQVIARMKQTLSDDEMKRIIFMPPLSDQDYRDAYLIGAVFSRSP